MSVDHQETTVGAPPGQGPSSALLAVLGGAGLAGAAGVALAAIAAHKVQTPELATAATMLLIHAAAVIAIAGVSTRMQSGWRWLITAGLMLCSALLFSGAVSYHAVMGEHVFPRAAPTGGSMLIISWCALAVLSVLEALDQR